MQSVKFLSIILSLFVVLFLNVGLVWAASPAPPITPRPSCTDTDFGCIPSDDPLKFTTSIYSIGLGFLGGVAVLAILYGSYQVLTSQGDPAKLQNGRSYIIYAIIGVVLAVGGFAVYRIIGADVLQIPGFK